MRFSTTVVILSALLPFAAATYTKGSSNSCNQNEFWFVLWSDKECCLPKGGPPTAPSPPKGSDCPPTSYYWGEQQGCCVPRNEPPTNAPEPQCRSNWSWRSGMRKCLPAPSTTTYSTPSQTPDNGHGKGGYRKREFKSRAVSLCPTGLDACPIKGLTTGDYECLDTDSELESCGGCTSLGKGQDCTTIPGAWNVGCERGSCIVYSCAGGFVLSLDGKSCIEL
ncbi:hypothetical protein BDQ17DRAFT_1294748 [Cyathus striatus]|nr:hypothetical protein BDQ17DRAFT_1294748 [Cyathus striatus]